MTPLHNPSSGEASSPSAATSPSSTRGCASALDPSNETSASMPGPASHDSPARSSTDFWSAAGSILALQDRTPPLQRKQFRGPPPLSLAQERLWSLEQSEPGLPYYHVPVTWHIRGDLELGALRKSLDFLFQRHEALRTSFPATLNGPVQQISEGHFELPLEVLPCKEAAEPDENAFARAREFARQPFDLEQGPLIRAVLYRLGPQVHWLVLVVHQMIFDGASMRAFSRDLRECYQAFVEQREPVLEELPVRYSDFALWQRECLRDDVLAEDDKFWSEQLRKSYEPLRFPIDHPRKNQGVIPGRQVAFNLPKREMDGLKKLGFDRGVTPFAAFLGCFQAFLARWTKQPDVLTLVSIAARNQRETRNLVGLIANVLPMRMDFSGNLTLEAVIERAGRVVSSSLAHQNLPLSRILEKLPSSRAAVSVPALQVLVIYNNAPLPSLRLPKVTFTPSLALDNGVTKFDLVLDIADSPQGVSGELKYRADLFEESTIVEFLAEWRAFVEAALIEPSATLNLDLSAEENPVAEGCSGTRCASAEAGAASTRNSRREGSAYVAPRSELEQKLASVWESVFDVHPIG
ncbi:MAG TPA: condensation domain-containing protein, partial [Verrucomicrobiae bacterium]|nr:condensation domain-containing protein [Verrucomicrobiae bacterium]